MSLRITQFYSADTLMSDLICERYDLLLVITRFGIPLGFGDQTIREVCEENNVHVETLHKHMGYEDKNVFPYVRALVDGTQKRGAGAYNIDIFSRRHDKVEARIGELKNILIKYFPDGSGYELTSVLHELFSAEDDLATHNFVEDFLFVPLIRSMEQKQNS